MEQNSRTPIHLFVFLVFGAGATASTARHSVVIVVGGSGDFSLLATSSSARTRRNIAWMSAEDLSPIFSQPTMFFFHNKLANGIFNRIKLLSCRGGCSFLETTIVVVAGVGSDSTVLGALTWIPKHGAHRGHVSAAVPAHLGRRTSRLCYRSLSQVTTHGTPPPRLA